MSRSYWLSLCAAVGIILANTANAVAESHDTSSNPARNQHTSVPIENFLPASKSGAYKFKLIEQTFGTEITTVQSPEDQKRAERGVEAEKKLADWTPWLFAVGLLEMAITGAGIYLLAKTLGHTKRAADAAVGTLAVITENGQRELRAYITVEPAGIMQLILSTKGIGQVAVKNVGRTPARKVSVHVRMALGHEGRDNFDVVENKETINRVIQPGGEMRQGSQDEIPVKDITNWRDYVFVWGIVHYSDGFGEPRFTRFCHRYWARSFDRSVDLLIEPPDIRPIIKVQSARYHLYGNNAD